MDDTLVDPAKVYRAAELAALLDLHPQTLYKMARRGDIPCKRFGRNVVFPQALIADWLAHADPPRRAGPGPGQLALDVEAVA